MSNQAILYLINATQQVNITMRSIIFALGLTSNFLNIIVFLSLKTFRESSCAFYLTAMSFVNIGQMFFGLFARVLSLAWGVDWTNTYLPYCKLRYYFFQLFAVTSYTCMYLATIDQYLATCARPQLQRLSNIKLARVVFALMFLIWILHCIPLIIFYNHVLSVSTNQTVCRITNPPFQRYYQYGYLLTLLGIIPVFITVVIGSLAYRNVKQLLYRTVPLVRRETDKQLTVMVLVQNVYNLFFIIPYIVGFLLSLNLSVDADPLYAAQINLTSAVTNALYYMTFSSGFYIYVIVSERFRRQFLYVLCNIHINRCRTDFARNQIRPDI